MNYPCNYDFTRIHEYKHYLNEKSDKTIIAKEYSESFEIGKNERYYPIPNDENTELYNKYLEKATGEYVAIVEPDDYVALDMYETLYQKAIQYDLDLIKSDFYRFIGTLDNREYIYNALDIESKDYNKVINLQEYLDLLFDNPKKLYRILKNLRSWFEYLFSVTNLPSKNGKWYKVIYLLGLKFSFRNKEKEAKMKLLEESENK